MTNENELPFLFRALQFSARKHRDQRRKDAEATPYINHPIGLATCLTNEGGIRDANVLAAALLHDTVEDTQTTFAELEEQFGPRVSAIVAEVTDDRSLPKPERKLKQIEHSPHLSSEAKLVKLADKICNLRDVANSPPPNWPLERRQAYFDWAKKVVDGLRGASAPLEASFDEAFSRRPTN